jgi:hypothetical protein
MSATLRMLNVQFGSLAISLVVNLAEVRAVAHDAQRHADESERGCAWFQMPTERFVWRGQRHMRVNPSVDDIAIHADYIRWLSWILHERILGRKIPVADLVDVVTPNGPNRAKNNRVANLLLLDHLLHAGKQIGVKFEP